MKVLVRDLKLLREAQILLESYSLFLDCFSLILSISTVEIITDPPRRVLRLGVSLKKIKAIIIPYIGCNELMRLAEAAEKCLRL